MFDNLKLIWKLAIPLAILITTTLGLVAFAKLGIDASNTTTAEIVDVYAARRTGALEVTGAMSEVANQTKNIIIETGIAERQVTAAHAAPRTRI